MIACGKKERIQRLLVLFPEGAAEFREGGLFIQDELHKGWKGATHWLTSPPRRAVRTRVVGVRAKRVRPARDTTRHRRSEPPRRRAGGAAIAREVERR